MGTYVYLCSYRCDNIGRITEEIVDAEGDYEERIDWLYREFGLNYSKR